MASNARKELAKALRVAFGAEQGNNNTTKDTGYSTFEDYEPPESLLEAIDSWANSSSIQSSTSERDIDKLRVTLLEHCFEQGTPSELPSSGERATQARSAFIIVLDRFSSLDIGVVTVKEIRNTWWNKLLLPVLTLSDSPSETIRVGRTALKAAKEMAIRALDAATTTATASEDEAEKTRATKWTLSVFRACLKAPNESYAQRNLQSILIAFGKSHPKDFFFAIGDLLDKPIEALSLLNTFIRIHPIQAYQVLHTPLFSKIIAMLDSLPIALQEEGEESHSPTLEDVADKLVWVSSALCTLNMLMPRIPTSLDKLLDRFFIILARCLLWHDSIRHLTTSSVEAETTDDEGDYHEGQGRSMLVQRPSTTLAPLLDYFTQLYGLFPANLIAFLSFPTRWLQAYYRRIRKRRHRVSSSANLSSLGRETFLQPLAAAGGLMSYSSSSTSADEGASGTDIGFSEAEEGGVEGAAQARRRRAYSKSGRKGQRSKLSKARRDQAAKQKKEKEALKQKDRERRRRGLSITAADSQDISTATEEKSGGTSSSAIAGDVEPDLSASASTSTSELRNGDSRAPKVRIEEPSTPGAANGGAQGHKADNNQVEHESDDDLSDTTEGSLQEIEEDLEALDLQNALGDFRWERVKDLSGPYLSQHVVVPGLIETSDTEFVRNKMRFKKLEAPDLIEEIVRTRLPQPIFPYHHHQQNSHDHRGSGHSISGEPMSANSLSSPPPSSTFTASTAMIGLSVDTLPGDRQITFMQSQLIFEMYQKNQLLQRLGSLLRDRIATSGAEADKQNLMHQIRSLKSQLGHSQEKLEQLRHESALSRDRLNKYSSDQSNRVEKLRNERQVLNTENTSLKAELADLKHSLASLNDELAESRKECFELKSERDYEKRLKEEKAQAAQQKTTQDEKNENVEIATA